MVWIIARSIKHCLDQWLLNYERLKRFSLEVCQTIIWAFQVAIVVKDSTANAGDTRDAASIPGLGFLFPLEEEMVSHSSILAWKIPKTEEPGRLQYMRLQRAGHDWATEHANYKRSVPLYSPHGLSPGNPIIPSLPTGEFLMPLSGKIYPGLPFAMVEFFWSVDWAEFYVKTFFTLPAQFFFFHFKPQL